MGHQPSTTHIIFMIQLSGMGLKDRSHAVRFCFSDAHLCADYTQLKIWHDTNVYQWLLNTAINQPWHLSIPVDMTWHDMTWLFNCIERRHIIPQHAISYQCTYQIITLVSRDKTGYDTCLKNNVIIKHYHILQPLNHINGYSWFIPPIYHPPSSTVPRGASRCTERWELPGSKCPRPTTSGRCRLVDVKKTWRDIFLFMLLIC